MSDISRNEWDIDGSGKMTDAQRRMLNAVCGDLAKYIRWHGHRLDKDDWRHLIAGTMLGWRTFPGIDRGQGAPGVVMLGGSSLSLSKTLARDAITQAIHIGEHPDEQGMTCAPIKWGPTVVRALYLEQEKAACASTKTSVLTATK